MALIHQATVQPSKAELLAAWLPVQPWGPEEGADLELVGAYRFDDPAGRVGLETHLMRAAGQLWQVALTYRDAPLPEAEAALVGRMRHSVLGERWVYDGCADPAYVRMLAATALTGVGQSVGVVEVDDRSRLLPPTVRLSGGGCIAAPIDISGFGSPTRDDGVAVLCSSLVGLRFRHTDQPQGTVLPQEPNRRMTRPVGRAGGEMRHERLREHLVDSGATANGIGTSERVKNALSRAGGVGLARPPGDQPAVP